jgi:hypothetical protein
MFYILSFPNTVISLSLPPKINFASSLTQDGSSLLNIQTNLSSALNIAAL